MVSSAHQKFLDQYVADELAEADLETALRHNEHWGFPWRHYAPLLRWAKDHGARLLALNLDPKIDGSLKERDQWAAKILAQEIQRRHFAGKPPSRHLILFGDLHLTRSHFPRALKKTLAPELASDLVVIHQNLESIYWKLAAQKPAEPGGIVSLRANEYCVFSAPPWSKIASLLDWAELHPIEYVGSGEHRLEEDPLTEADLDPLAQVRTFYQTLSAHFQHPEKTIEDLTLLPKDPDAQDWRRIARAGLKRQELQLAKSLHEFNFRFDLPAQRALYLGDGDRNSTAEMAALTLLNQLQTGRQKQEPFFRATSEDYERRILRQSFAYLGSLLLNPRRKSALPEDHRRWLRKNKPVNRIDRVDAAARRAALKWARASSAHQLAPPTGALANWRASVRIGQTCGYLLFERWMLGEVSMKEIRKIFFKRWTLERNGTRSAYTLLVDAIGKIPDYSLRAKEL